MYQTLSGERIICKVPEDAAQGHFGINLIKFVIYLKHHAHVTQPLILEQLMELGIDIPGGQVNRTITQGHDLFLAEKEEILCSGLEVSDYAKVEEMSIKNKGQCLKIPETRQDCWQLLEAS
jgi:hypothetical protein